jgi:transcriptional regulator with XRE-family HTH domain
MQDTARTGENTVALAMAIGHRVRHERHAHHWTLDQLAEIAGVSRRMLINVEQGVANPSVATLLKISDALGVGLPALVEPPRSRPVKITRNSEGATLWSSDSGGRGVLVAGTESPDVVELWDWTLASGDKHASEAHSSGTMELVQVLHGQLVITIAGEAITLDAGDAASFPGDVQHAYANPGSDETRFSLVVFEPGVGVHSESEHFHD